MGKSTCTVYTVLLRCGCRWFVWLPVLSCLGDCVVLAAPNTTSTGNRTIDHGSYYENRCRDKFILQGTLNTTHELIQCLGTKLERARLPCIPVTCPPYTLSANTSDLFRTTSGPIKTAVGTVINYTCHYVYDLVGPSFRECKFLPGNALADWTAPVVCTCKCVFVCLQVCAGLCMRAGGRAGGQACVRVCVCACVRVCVCACVRVLICNILIFGCSCQQNYTLWLISPVQFSYIVNFFSAILVTFS